MSKDKDIVVSQSENSVKLNYIGTKYRSIDDVIKASKIDLTKWEAYDPKYSTSEVTMKIKKGYKENTVYIPVKTTNHHISVKFKKRKIDYQLELINAIKNLKPRDIKYNYNRKSVKKAEIMAMVGFYDEHWGMLANAKETGHADNDLKIVRKRHRAGMEQIIPFLKKSNVTKIVTPFGHDLTHINDRFNKTPRSKNELEVDTRLFKIFDDVCEQYESTVNELVKVADVDFELVPGNHDEDLSRFVAKYIYGVNKTNPHIKFNLLPTLRKYYKFHNVMIGMAHMCNLSKHQDLQNLMSAEQSEMWGKTKWREWHTGHIHINRKVNFLSITSTPGCLIRTVPSLCPPDSWHAGKGFVNKMKHAEIYLYCKDAICDIKPIVL